MQASFSIHSGHQFVIVHLDEARANGYGAAVAPRILIQPSFDLSYQQIPALERIDVREMRVRLTIGQNLFLNAIPVMVNRTITAKHPHVPNNSITLEFPVTQAILSAIERERGGKDLQFKFFAALDYEILRELTLQTKEKVWTLRLRETASTESSFVVPASDWIQRVLQGVGYGVVHVLELPAIPIESHAGLKHSFDALLQAQECHKAGRYDDAAGKCRVALEPFFEQVEKFDEKGTKRLIPKLKSSWEKKLGKVTYEWLDASFGAIRQAGNSNHHSPNARFGQLDSQMLLAVTTSLIAYIARNPETG